MLQKVLEIHCLMEEKEEKYVWGLSQDLNPGPPAPKAGIIPLDHWATVMKAALVWESDSHL